jgi:benzoate/toluate 1,2-dioxygenase beta subunit
MNSNLADLNAISAFLFREVRHLDDRLFEEWLQLYAPDAEYWMPAWDDDDQLTDDPHSQISLIYYPNLNGLEDRVFRIKTERSAASMPEPRTGHHLSNVEIVSQDGSEVKVRFNWHTLSYRYSMTDSYFGTSHYTLDVSGAQPVIKRKRVVLKNDYIHHVIDVYHI